MNARIETHIAPDLSVYRLIARVAGNSTSLHSRRGMSFISHEIEDATMIGGEGNRVFSSFQRMSRFLPQVGRYVQLAEAASEIYVFGIMDVPELPQIRNVHYVPITPDHQLAKEWFLVSYGTPYYSALVTEELSDMNDPDPEREFIGLWTFDLPMVATLHEWLCGVVGISPMVSQMSEGRHDYENQIRLMGNSLVRLMQCTSR